MMMKILRSSIVLVMVLLLAGCGSNSAVSSDGVKKCTRTGTVTNGSTEMNYEVYYKGEDVVLLHSTEKIISDSSSVLDTYEEAYKSIFKQYEGLEYYDNKITRNSNSVTNEITINYEKIDMGKLQEKDFCTCTAASLVGILTTCCVCLIKASKPLPNACLTILSSKIVIHREFARHLKINFSTC